MRQDYYCLHGITLSLTTDNVSLAEAIKVFLQHFQQPKAADSTDLRVHLLEVNDRTEIPIELSSTAQLLSAYLEETDGDLDDVGWPCDLYRDGDVKIAELHDYGCLRIDARQGYVEGYIVDPSDLHPDVCAAIFHFLMTDLLKHKGMYTIHATALEKMGHGFLIPGKSGQGKTTCCLSLLRSGYRFLADDHPFIRTTNSGPELLSFPEKIDVTDETLAFFPELYQASEGLYQGLSKRYFYADRFYPGETIDSCKPAFIILPQVADCSQSYLEPLAKQQALEELLPQSLLVFDRKIAQQQFQILAELVEQADCYRLYGGRNVLELPELIDTLLGVA